jgi:uncharacterized protein (TIGR01777 family)
MRVFVTGGTGLVGRRLIWRLRERRDDVLLLTRRLAAARDQFGTGCDFVEGDPTQAGPWMDRVAECDAVVNLAGENIFARRWNDEFKARLRDSRVKSTENIVQALARSPRTADGTARVLVNASAIGYYGPHGDEEITEESPPGNDTLAHVCVAWENAARAVEASGVRLAIVRIGVVLDRDGGALAKMLLPFKMGVGGPSGTGKQWMAWIHHADLIGILLLALDNAALTGPINATAPNPVTNHDFAKALGTALGRPAFMPTPGFALRLGLGQVAEVITTGQRVLPKRALAAGYTFRFPEVGAALADVLK